MVTAASSVPPRPELMDKVHRLAQLIAVQRNTLAGEHRSLTPAQHSPSVKSSHQTEPTAGPSRHNQQLDSSVNLVLPSTSISSAEYPELVPSTSTPQSSSAGASPALTDVRSGPSSFIEKTHGAPWDTTSPIVHLSTDAQQEQRRASLPSASTSSSSSCNLRPRLCFVPIAPRVHQNSDTNSPCIIVLKAPTHNIVIKRFVPILPAAPNQNQPSAGQQHVPLAPTSAATVTTSSNTVSTTSASSNNTMTLLATSSSGQHETLRPRTLHEKQILHRIGEIVQHWDIPPEMMLTPPKASHSETGPSTSTPLVPIVSEDEEVPSDGQRPKRKLTFEDENEAPTNNMSSPSPAKIQAVDTSLDTTPGAGETSINDPSWKPSESRCSISDEDRFYREDQDEDDEIATPSSQENLEVDAHHEDPDELLFVSLSKLMQLLKYCGKCQSVNQIKKMKTGAYVSFKCTCQKGHAYKWSTHEIFEKKPVINIKLAASLLLTGQNFASFSRLAKLLNLNIFAKDTFLSIIENYAKPILTTHWASAREQKLTMIKDGTESLNIGGDARFDSRGKAGAKYGIYTMMKSSSGEILDFIIMQKGIEPGELESKGFLISMSRIVATVGPDKIKAFCSDRNYTVGKKMKDYFPMIYHAFDVR
jgi:hypothetical protein